MTLIKNNNNPVERAWSKALFKKELPPFPKVSKISSAEIKTLELPAMPELPPSTTVGFHGTEKEYQPSGEYSGSDKIGFARNNSIREGTKPQDKRTSPQIGFRF